MRPSEDRQVATRASTPVLATALALLAGLFPTAERLEAQQADPSDVESVGAIITAVYDVISGDAGEARDWDRWRSLFAEGATLSAVGVRSNGTVGRAIMTPESYIERSGASLEQSGFVEAEVGRSTEHFGLIAHSFSTYVSFRSRADTEPFQRGINSFQLMNDGERWWVVSVFWQAETQAHPIPEKYVGDIGGSS